MAKGRKTGEPTRPQPVGLVTGWWFPWQVDPGRLAAGRHYYRVSVYRRSTANQKRMQRIKARHVRRHGQWCPGVIEIDHAAHSLSGGAFLTVDHIVPLAAGGSHHPSNLRVICNVANTRLDRALRDRRTASPMTHLSPHEHGETE